MNKRRVIVFVVSYAVALAVIVVLGLALQHHFSAVVWVAWVFNCTILGIAFTEINRRLS